MTKKVEENLSFEKAAHHMIQLKHDIEQVIFGQEAFIIEALCTFLSAGHILITGAPGLAKTTLVRVFAQKLSLNFGRIQFTPDLLPSDITGSEILNFDTNTNQRKFEFSQGPIFANLLLADEVNRASPRTQSATLEAMQERKVTIAGKEYWLPRPFMVFATQNPFESEGTFPLPEAQLDRFLLHTLVDYPAKESEATILKQHANNSLVGEVNEPKTKEKNPFNEKFVEKLINFTQKIHVPDEIVDVINELVRSTRPDDSNCPEPYRNTLWYGAGPRAGISLISACRALALMTEEETVGWHHVKRLAKPTLRHRIQLSRQMIDDAFDVDSFVDILIEQTEERHKNLAQGVKI